MFTRILVPLDGSPFAEQAIGQAAAIARATGARIDLVLIHEPLPYAGFDDTPWSADRRNESHRYLEAIVKELESGASIEATHVIMRGAPAGLICERATEIGADLIVMTSHGRTGLRRAWLGSTADSIVRRSAIPVLMLRSAETANARAAAHKLFQRILVPLDGSTGSNEILRAAVRLAQASGAHLMLLRVVQPIPLVTREIGIPVTYVPGVADDVATQELVAHATEQLEERAREIEARDGLSVTFEVVVSPTVAGAILERTRGYQADAVAMTTTGHGLSRLFLGSIADKVVRGSELPALLLRPVTRPSQTVHAADAARALPHVAPA